MQSDVTTDQFFGTLDYFGRPMVTIKKANAVHDLCDHTMTVRYHFNESNMYLDVFCVFALLFGLYMTMIIYSNLEMDLESKHGRKKVDDKLKEN